MTNKILFFCSLLLATSTSLFAAEEDWFETLKARGEAETLYRVLHAMPKGGDLHNHLSGAVFSEWWYEIALAQKTRGYEYFTKVRIVLLINKSIGFYLLFVVQYPKKRSSYLP